MDRDNHGMDAMRYLVMHHDDPRADQQAAFFAIAGKRVKVVSR